MLAGQASLCSNQDNHTITCESIWVESVASVAAARVTANGVVAVLIAAICHFHTLINVITSKTIHVEPIANVAATVVGTNGVMAILSTLICVFHALVNICITSTHTSLLYSLQL